MILMTTILCDVGSDDDMMIEGEKKWQLGEDKNKGSSLVKYYKNHKYKHKHKHVFTNWFSALFLAIQLSI